MKQKCINTNIYNNNNNLLHLYSAFLDTQSTLHSKGGNLLIHHQCAASTWMMRRQPYIGAFPLHGTARYGSLLGGFPLGTVPGT